jgi:glycosyltransferase involved in cell wall biosynthesis
VVEAMFKNVPVLARNVGGVPEAMDGAGVAFDEARPEELASLMHQLIAPARFARKSSPARGAHPATAGAARAAGLQIC